MLLVVGLLILDLLIYLPFFKMFEKQVLEQEQPVESKVKAAQPGRQGVTA
ncbi:phosphotransferase system cellobiose-specific component IIC [Vibrio cholerae]|nr:phosphotransferase system cellobiose-specific component IIC [Vibrio cholerae]